MISYLVNKSQSDDLQISQAKRRIGSIYRIQNMPQSRERNRLISDLIKFIEGDNIGDDIYQINEEVQEKAKEYKSKYHRDRRIADNLISRFRYMQDLGRNR